MSQQVISHFQAWEEAIKYCKELAVQYENETFQYMELSEVLVRLLRLFSSSYCAKLAVLVTIKLVFDDGGGGDGDVMM